MRRLDALTAVYAQLERCVVVTIMGAVAAELQSLGHRPSFFYLQHAMGLASSMGLGIALARPELQVVVLDGDGSLLMNLGSLTTMARYRPKNLLHIVFDNDGSNLRDLGLADQQRLQKLVTEKTLPILFELLQLHALVPG